VPFRFFSGKDDNFSTTIRESFEHWTSSSR
jgi:hypothetical protein